MPIGHLCYTHINYTLIVSYPRLHTRGTAHAPCAVTRVWGWKNENPFINCKPQKNIDKVVVNYNKSAVDDKKRIPECTWRTCLHRNLLNRTQKYRIWFPGGTKSFIQWGSLATHLWLLAKYLSTRSLGLRVLVPSLDKIWACVSGVKPKGEYDLNAKLDLNNKCQLSHVHKNKCTYSMWLKFV